jgi:hypothetical protein
MTVLGSNSPAMPDDEKGEGNYKAARTYQQEQHAFVAEHGDEIEGKAREAAAALDGDEADELAQAEAEGRAPAQK